MPFSQDIKNEITGIKIYNKDEIISFLSAIFMFSGNVVIKGENIISFYIKTESKNISKKLSYLFKKMFSITLEIYQKNNYNFSRNQIYILQYTGHLNEVKKILKKLYVLGEDKEGFIYLRDDIDEILIKSENSTRAFIKGAYISSGSISNPEKSYHLEFISHNSVFAEEFSKLLNNYDIKSQVAKRKEVYIIYTKESESIADILKLIGANNSLFEFENIRIKKNMRNNVNRIVNCETSNLSKMSKAYVRHKNAIEYIMQKKPINYLPNDLKEIALLRLERGEISLEELGKSLSRPISKSGVNYRLNKIEKIAKQIEEEENNDKKRGNY